jgi:uncharacterized membrane protein YccF (DUF307 family)
MLNTDLHNRTVKKSSKMTLAQFLRNNECVARCPAHDQQLCGAKLCGATHPPLPLITCRGIDDNHDLPRAFLESIYESISRKEIHMRAELPQASAAASAGGDGGLAAGGGPGTPPPSSASSAAPSALSASSSAVGNLDALDSDGEAAVAAAVGTHWDGVLQRQAAVSAYTPAAGVNGSGAYAGYGYGHAADNLEDESAVEVVDEEAVAHARDMFALIAGAWLCLGHVRAHCWCVAVFGTCSRSLRVRGCVWDMFALIAGAWLCLGHVRAHCGCVVVFLGRERKGVSAPCVLAL